jgi:hypothetical protein
LFTLSTADAWGTLVGPAGAGEIQGVCVSPDDKLVAWKAGTIAAAGLYTWDGSTWVKIFPGTALIPSEPNCSLLDDSGGSVLFSTYDTHGSSLHEYFTPEAAATVAWIVTWFREEDLFLYSAEYYAGAVYLGGGEGAEGTDGQGIQFRKERAARPLFVQEFGDGIRGAIATEDFRIRGMATDGDILWVGSASRMAGTRSTVVGMPGVYRYQVDEQGIESVAPSSFVDSSASPDNVASLVYDVGILKKEILCISTKHGVYTRSNTDTALKGEIEFSIWDLRAPDHIKTWRFIQALVEDMATNDKVGIYYRAGTLMGSFTQLGTDILSSTLDATGAQKLTFPHDSASTGKYFYSKRQVQLKLRLERDSGAATNTPRVTSIALDAAQIKPVGV